MTWTSVCRVTAPGYARPSRRLTATWPLSRSRGPSSTRNGHAFLDPFPILHAAAEVALVDVHFERRAVPDDGAQLRGQFVRRAQDRVACFWLRRDRQDDDVGWRNARRQDQAVVVARAS